MNKIYQFLVEHVNIDDNVSYKDWPPVKQLLYVNAQVSDALFRAYSILESSDTTDDKELVDALTGIWDKYFVPIDLPLNNFLERMVENYGRGMLGDLIAQLASLVQKGK